MFERFTEQARQVVVLAQEEARALRHNYIGTEHLLLGLLKEGGAGASVLVPFGVTEDEVRMHVARIIGHGESATTGQIPFTPRAKKVLELSLREALDSGGTYIGPEHILLGMLREGEGVAARILIEFAPLGDIRAIALAGTAGRLTGEERAVRPQLSMGTFGGRRRRTPPELVVGWLLFAVALGVGVLIGWAIWS
jgi:ATP-dependent Clp protease ATP-binding subunit ClpC